MTFWEWFTIITGSAMLISLAIAGTGWRSDRQMRRLQADIHAATQATLTDMNKGFRESQERLGQALAEGHKALAEGHKILGEAVKGLGDTLARMDQRLDRMDERWAQAFERMDQRADDRHRESLQAIQALRGYGEPGIAMISLRRFAGSQPDSGRDGIMEGSRVLLALH